MQPDVVVAREALDEPVVDTRKIGKRSVVEMVGNRTYSWPHGHWNWPVPLSHQHGVRAGNFVFTGGQADLDEQGNVQHPDNLELQVASVTRYLLAILSDLEAKASDLVRLVVYFVGDADTELTILNQISEILGPDARPVVNTVALPQLCYPGMQIELEGVAMCCNDLDLPRQHMRLDNFCALPAAYSHLVVCDDVIFLSDVSAVQADGSVMAPGDVITQSTIMMDRVGTALDAINASYNDVLKLNVFYVGDGTAENWEQPALIRQSYFTDPGPAATGISLPRFAQAGLMTKIAVTAMRSAGFKDAQHNLTRQYSWPEGHWNWTVRLPYKHGNRCGRLIHLGGQVSLDSDGQVIDPDDIVAQTRTAMNNLAKVLAELGATLDHIVKVTTFYEGQAGADELHQNLQVRSSAFSKPGPATSGIPVPSLVYENMRIEIEAIAVID